MILFLSGDSESIKAINIDSDESEQFNFSQNPQEEAKDVSANLYDSEFSKSNTKVTYKKIRKIFYLILLQANLKRNY